MYLLTVRITEAFVINHTIQIATFWQDDALVQKATLPSVGTYSVYTGHMPDDLLELVGIRRLYAKLKAMYKASPIGKILIF